MLRCCFDPTTNRSSESRALQSDTAACAQQAVERRGELWLRGPGPCTRTRARAPRPHTTPAPARTRALYTRTHTRTRAPIPRTRTPAHTRTRTRTRTRTPIPRGAEMPISVSNAEFCNRKWHLDGKTRGEEGGHAERHGERWGTRGRGNAGERAGAGARGTGGGAGAEAREGTRAKGGGTGMPCKRPRRSLTSSRPSSLPDAHSTASRSHSGQPPGDFGLAATAR